MSKILEIAEDIELNESVTDMIDRAVFDTTERTNPSDLSPMDNYIDSHKDLWLQVKQEIADNPDLAAKRIMGVFMEQEEKKRDAVSREMDTVRNWLDQHPGEREVIFETLATRYPQLLLKEVKLTLGDKGYQKTINDKTTEIKHHLADISPDQLQGNKTFMERFGEWIKITGKKWRESNQKKVKAELIAIRVWHALNPQQSAKIVAKLGQKITREDLAKMTKRVLGKKSYQKQLKATQNFWITQSIDQRKMHLAASDSTVKKAYGL